MSPVTTSGFARNDGVQLRWTLDQPADGAGVPVLLINGLGSPLVAFEPGFVDLLVGRGLAVARFDNRDVGQSDRVERGPAGQPTPYTLADMAGDAAAVLDALGWSSAHVLGQSMGGMIAQQLTIDRPERVRSLLPLMTSSGNSSFGRATPEAMEAMLLPAPTEFAAWLDFRVETERVWASPSASEAWQRAKGEAMWNHGIDSAGSVRQYRAISVGGKRDGALAAVTTPTLVIHGSADTLIGADAGRHLADVIPGARFEKVDGLGHDLPPEFWPLLVDLAAGFIDQVESTGG